ncbi:hypothetical protein [Flavobacterium sp. NRK1]|uniref:hypothetical protein n=1 Tax=Flavobacterium sp. NRK1 TaxID=2954929 RepID=UPI002091F6B9|nr:hypothetical protein [Flavobacterium sp. NRK1]MCO6149324.1 hypothetical protein [Flavobacterium sp. NRK1]
MIRKLLLIYLLFQISVNFAQQSYEFDYVLQYNISKQGSSGILQDFYTRYDFINSKDNSYILTVYDSKEKINMQLMLDTGKVYIGDIIREDFFVEAISLKCPKSWYKNNSDYENLKDFQVINNKDTLINTEVFKRYTVLPLNKKEIKKFNLSPTYYIIDNKYNFNFPVVTPANVLYRKWKKGEKLPNGVIKEIYQNTKDGKKVILQLAECMPTRKLILIDDKCK